MSAPSQISARRLGIVCGIGIFQLLVFLPIGLTRLADGDEGYYLLAAKLVLDGQWPYLDFLYTQMPLLPYFYGAWMGVFGVSWYAGRVLSVLLAVGAGLLLYGCLYRTRRSHTLALAGLLLYITSAYVFGWYTVAKTYALSTFLLLAAYAVWCGLPALTRHWRYLLSGLLLGLAVDTRLFFLAAAPAFLLGIYRENPRMAAAGRGAAWFGVGLLAALGPVALLALADPAAFHFGNLGYHALRSSHDLIGDPVQKGRTLMAAVGMQGGPGVMGLQFLLLLLPVVAYGFLRRLRDPRTDLAFHIFVLLLLASLLPTPTYVQYFCVLVPFMILCATILADPFPAGMALRRLDSGRFFALLFFLLYVLVAPLDLWRFTVTGHQLPGIRLPWDRSDWTIASIQAVSRTIDQHNPEGRPVIALWPGYLVEAQSPAYRGFENHFGPGVADRLLPAQRQRFHLIGLDEAAAAIAAETPLVVVGNWHQTFSVDLLRQHGYEAVYSRGKATLYRHASP